MFARLVGVVSLVALLSVGVLSGAALAVEGPDAGPRPTLEELGSQTEVSRDFFPEEAETPVFTAFLLYPLLIGGLFAAFVILALYLKWQPGFEEERQKASKRR
jgi:hypothetical protein